MLLRRLSICEECSSQYVKKCGGQKKKGWEKPKPYIWPLSIKPMQVAEGNDVESFTAHNHARTSACMLRNPSCCSIDFKEITWVSGA